MPVITDLHKSKLAVSVLLPLALVFWFQQKRHKMWAPLLTTLLLIASVDNFSHRILKENIQRPRPPLVEKEIQIRAPQYGGYSFPSNHAANTFAIATFLGACYPAAWFSLTLFAFIGAYSRVYVGVHYPSDVLAGALIGIFFGLFFWRIFVIIRNKIVDLRDQ
jgi:undecaprenyl-diphosphatase